MLLKTQEPSSSQSQTASTWSSISKLTSTTSKGVTVDGHSLTISDVNAVAKSGVKVYLDESVKGPVQASVDFLEQKAHLSLYGITTGFGGSADTRTRDTKALQMSIIEHQLCGVLPVEGSYQEMLLSAMPIPIVRGAMLIRVNSLSRGHSGVRLKVLDAILAMLNLGLVPCVPLRGSISASGDLSPLSFVAGAICGHPSVSVFNTTSNPPTILSAPEAIAQFNLETITLAAKEGLGILNGTAFSAAAGALAVFEAEVLGMMAQAVTAMTVEAMMGHLDSFDPFISDIARPHWGQIEVARNVRTLLADSKFIVPEEGEVAIKDDIGTLRQDRYALRTSPQWIGPQLENLALARKQVEVELNSTTDNPLIDVEDGRFLHGGNFQAMSVTAAMESTRLAIQNLGRLSFAQVTELINCTMNGGLPSCLAGDEPSTNYHCKGLDIHCAAYTSELGYLANPVSTHVMSAEMHNQSVNSLALISARKTLEAAEIMRLLVSTHLYCVCQAIDLRVIDLEFKQTMRKEVARSIQEHLGNHLNQDAFATLQRDLNNAFIKRIEHTSSMDSGLRFEDAAKHCVGVLVDALMASGVNEGLAAVSAWKTDFESTATQVYREIRDTAISGGDNVDKAEKMMGSTFALYSAVRRDIGVQVRKGDVASGKYGKSVGSQVSLIVNGMKNGKLVDAAMRMFEQS